MAPANNLLTVEVVYCAAAGCNDLMSLQVAAGCTAQQAITASGLLERHGLDISSLRLGVWCKVCDPGWVLRDRDRVEIYRPLTVDPKEARRLRYRKARNKV